MMFPEQSRGPRSGRWILIAAVVAGLFANASALDPYRSISQYVRQQWSSGNEFPGGSVNAIEQAAGGYLWIGTDKGLVRFDGFSFRSVPFPSVNSVSASPVLGLLADDNGHLWVEREGAGVLHYSGEHFEGISSDSNLISSQVTAMSRGRDGALLFADVEGGILRLQKESLQRVAVPNSLLESSPTISIAEAGDGKIWIGTLSTGLFVFANNRAANVSAGLPERKINCLLPVGNHELWVGTDHGLYRGNGTSFQRVELPSSANLQILTMIRDRDSNVWVGTAGGLLRINNEGISFSDERALRGNGGISTLFEDREGNVWVGGERGLGRIRDSVFVTYSNADGPSFEHVGPIFVDEANRTWFAPAEGGLYFLKDGRAQSVTKDLLAQDVVYSIGGRKGEVWIGRQRRGLTRLVFHNSTLEAQTYTQAQGLAQNSVYSIFLSNDGAVWAGTLSGGVSRFKDGRFITYTRANGLTTNSISSILETQDGTMWFGTMNGLSSLSSSRWKTYHTQDGLPSDKVNCLLEDTSGTLWVGTSEGLAFFRSGRFQTLPDWPAVLREPLAGIAEDNNGSFWMASSTHVLKVSRDKLLAGGLREADVRLYGTQDGLPSKQGVYRSRSIIRDSSGRIWFSFNGGLSVSDPTHLIESSAPAIAHVEAVSADGIQMSMGAPLRIPPSQKRITFGYTGLSLSIPTRVRFRYILEGFDHDWSDIVQTREAVYTNLGPGKYRFRVLASNSHGVWNGPEAAISFNVEPALWQTWWFRSGIIVSAGFMTLLLYRLRMGQLTRQLNIRFEERLAERTRIAQELHDTLLQGFVSVSMQLHVADDLLPENSLAKPMVGRVLELMKDVVDESRNTVRGLRSPNAVPLELDHAFSRIPEELGSKHNIDFRVIVEGRPRPLSPLIRDDVYRMGREAVVNAFRHSGAKAIQVVLEYGSRYLRLLVRDDGCGIDEQVLRSGREGHFGLPGMRERAERIGARLRVWSHPSHGTEIDLSVPSRVAFEAGSPSGMAGLFGKLYPRKREREEDLSDIRK